MRTAPHVLTGHTAELLMADDGQPVAILYPQVDGAEVKLSAWITRPLIKWLDRPNNPWLRKASQHNIGIVLSHELQGIGFDGIYEDNEGREYAPFDWSLQDAADFLSAAGNEPSLSRFCNALRDALNAWGKLPTLPTHIHLDAQDW